MCATFNVGDYDQAAGGADAFERKQKVEQAYASKVRSQLSYIPDLLVSVSVDDGPAETAPARLRA